MPRKAAKHWLIAGMVQGVGFRYFVQNKATALGVRGWARNLDDGRVEVYGVGAAEQLSNFAAYLHRGPRLAQVRHVEELEGVVEDLTGFSIR